LRRHIGPPGADRPEQVAYIGDDTNDVEVMKLVGLAACPADATPFAKAVAHYVCPSPGGHGAFREVAELIIAARAGFGRKIAKDAKRR
jgi:3-deoxy-D-manno-octulosonate 8-phosphate phosphatase (KDO 8-P phosphatase)